MGTDGDGGGSFSQQDSLRRILSLWPTRDGQPTQAPYVVFTGGEPALQLDQSLVDGLHAVGAKVAIETNGSLALPHGLDWICVSPKRLLHGEPQPLMVTQGHELKLVMPQTGFDLAALESLDFATFLFNHWTTRSWLGHRPPLLVGLVYGLGPSASSLAAQSSDSQNDWNSVNVALHDVCFEASHSLQAPIGSPPFTGILLARVGLSRAVSN